MLIWNDLRYAFRTFGTTPGFTTLAVLTIAVGIGANSAIFSVVNSVLLRPLPFTDSGRIVQIVDNARVGSGAISSSFPKFSFLHDHARSFSDIAATGFAEFQVTGPAKMAPGELAGARVSEDFFRVFGVAPTAGRPFLESENRPGGRAVAVISDMLWRNRFGANPAVIGNSVGLDGASTTIIGIMPPGFDFPPGTEIWVPRVFDSNTITPLQIQNGASFLALYGRLANGVDAAAALAEVQVISHQYDAEHPGFGDIGRDISTTPLRESLVGNVRLTLLVLLGAVGLVLLIAAANVANLLLARATARQKEVAIRAALGANRSRLLAQFLTESVLLSVSGATLGLLLAFSSIRLIPRFLAGFVPFSSEIHIDGAVLAFTVVIAVLTGILFGLGPAMHSVRIDLNEMLNAASRSLSSGGRLRGVMVVSEVALAVVLLIGAGLLIRSFLRLESVDPGFRPQKLLTMKIGLAPAHYSKPVQRLAFYDRFLERAESTAGVQDVSLTSALPLANPGIGFFFNIEGRPQLTPDKAPIAFLRVISPGYLRTMGIPFLRGRSFAASDTADTPRVAIINETMAHRHWPDRDPIGQHVVYSRERVTVEVIGVAADVKFAGLGVAGPFSEMYVPFRQRPALTMYVAARTSVVDPVGLATALRKEVSAIDPEQPVADVLTMDEVIANSVSEPRLRTILMGSFAALAVFLAMIGVFGVVAWSVSQRTAEIGIRIALGARGGNVIGMIVRQSFANIGIGLLIGAAGALALSRVLSGLLFEISPEDPRTFAAVLILLSLVALAASALAARRAIQIDPVIALRGE
jgi:putative ABC transport system permease protein